MAKTLVRNKNNIILDWKHIYNDKKVILQILDCFKEWKILYWGRKTRYIVDNLAPCSWYNFRIREENQSEWTYFRSATDVGPFYMVMHMTRAVLLGKSALIRQLSHKRPVLLETENKDHKTPLIQAIEQDNSVVVHLLINLGANVNNRLKFTQRTPLMIAIYRSRLEIASYLIDKGAHISAVDVNGLNILHFAVESNVLDNVIYVINLGIDVNSKDRHGWTVLKRSVELGCDKEIINYLNHNGARI